MLIFTKTNILFILDDDRFYEKIIGFPAPKQIKYTKEQKIGRISIFVENAPTGCQIR